MNMIDPLRLADACARRNEIRGLDYALYTWPQRQVLSDTSRFVLWRDGNQMGKSWWLAAEAVYACMGMHPFRPLPHNPPVKVLVVGFSLEQMLPLMEKIWYMVPKDLISPDNGFAPGRGIIGKPPKIVFVDGPGKGSVISFATYKQGAARIAGGTYHLVLMDEPSNEEVYGEIVPRIRNLQGYLRMGMTPVLNMPDQSWLRELVNKGLFSEHNYHLKEENCWPEGLPRPWLTQKKIEAENEGLLAAEVKMRTEGAWEPIFEGRWLKGFDENCIRSFTLPPGTFLGIGIDHGTAAGKEAAVLVAIVGRNSDRPKVFWLDEYVSDGFTTPENDAHGIIDMIRRNGFSYNDIDDWVGDIPSLSRKHAVRKSNSDLRKELSRLLNIPLSKMKIIQTPRKWAGSLTYGMRLLNTLFERRDENNVPDGIVSPNAPQFADACQKFQGDRYDKCKDVLDAGRYIVEKNIKNIRPSGLISY